MGGPGGIISDNLLLHPSSKIISCRDGHLSFGEDIFNQIISFSDDPPSDKNDFPVALLSFVGSPSNEKNLLLRSFVQFYDGEPDDEPKGKKKLKIQENTHSSYSSDFKPDTEDLTDSGIYLLHKPYYLEPSKETRYVLLMLYLYRCKGGTDRDSQLLEMLLILLSSRIAEVALENEQIRMLRQWDRMKIFSTQHCHSFLYILPKTKMKGDSPRVITKKEAKQRLVDKMKIDGDPSQQGDVFKMEKMGDLNVIEMKRMESLETMTVKPFLSAMGKLRSESKLYFNFDKEGKLVRLGGLPQFIKNCIQSVNKMTTSPTSSTKPKHFTQTTISPQDLKSDDMDASTSQPGRGPLNKSSLDLDHRYSEDNPTDSGNAAGPIQRGIQEGNELIEEDRFAKKLKQTPPEQVRQQTGSAELEQDNQLARKLIPEVVNFYNDEMKRFLSEGLYDPGVLNDMHEQLSYELTSQFKTLFEVNDKQRKKLGRKLTSSLNECFPRHSQRNSENWKMKQAKISKCLQKMMSLYMERIENVLLQNPHGLPSQELEREDKKIVKRIRKKLATEIREKVRDDEPMTGHLDSLQAEIDEYWDCVQERNNENMERSEQQNDDERSNELHAHNSEAQEEEEEFI